MKTLEQIVANASLQDKLRESMRDMLLEVRDWMYSYRMDVIDYHVSIRTEYRFPQQPFLDNEYISTQLSDDARSILLYYTEPWTEGEDWVLEIPIEHLENPALVTDLVIARERARAAKVEADAVAHKAEVERRIKALTEELTKL